MFMLIVSNHVFTCFGKVVMSQRKCFLSYIDDCFDCGVFGFQIGVCEVERKVGMTLID